MTQHEHSDGSRRLQLPREWQGVGVGVGAGVGVAGAMGGLWTAQTMMGTTTVMVRMMVIATMPLTTHRHDL